MRQENHPKQTVIKAYPSRNRAEIDESRAQMPVIPRIDNACVQTQNPLLRKRRDQRGETSNIAGQGQPLARQNSHHVTGLKYKLI